MNRKLKIVNSFINKDFEGILIKLDGNFIKTPKDLYKIFKNNLTFPDYFGENWNAFWDVITDEDFIKKDIKIVIYNYKNMFTDYEDKKIFSRVLIDWLQSDFISINISIFIIKG